MRTLLLLALVLLIGCGPSTSEIHGTVRLRGEPLKVGTVVLLASDNKTHPADIGPDGTYRVKGIARGPVRVTVFVDGARPAPRAEPKGDDVAKGEDDSKAKRKTKPLAPSPVDPKYNDDKLSGLSFTASEAVQEYSPDLK